MRVLQILYYYTPHLSGVTIHAERLARRLAARGHTATVLTSRHERSSPARETADGVHIVRLPVLARISRGVVMPSLLPAAVRLMREHDVVHLHQPMLEAPALAALARLLGKRLIITHHSDLKMMHGWLNRLANWVIWVTTIAAYALAHQIIASTADQAAASPTLRWFRKKTTINLPPVEIDEPLPTAGQAFRRRHRLGERPLIGFAGRFTADKGPDDLLRALPLIQRDLPEAKIVFAGPYERVVGERFYDRCAALLETHRDHILMLGAVSDQELIEFYAASDVVVLPSINSTETFGLVQVEAMLCGTPVVASDLPGVRTPVQVTGMGRITPPRNVPALATAIIAVIQHRSAYVRPRDEIAKHFSVETTVETYLRVYAGDPLVTDSASAAR